MVGFGEGLLAVATGGLSSKKFRGEAGKALFGKSAKNKQLSLLTPEQQQLTELINEGLTKGSGPFAELLGSFNESEFNKGVSEPAMKHFQEKILPQLQEKFIAGNQALGSGMRQGQLDAATDFQSKLAGLRYNAQQQQQQNRMGGLQTALGVRGFENLHTPAQKGLVQGFAQNMTNRAADAASAAIAG